MRIAVAQPRCVARDVAANALEHAAAVRAAGARVVVFPELSLTGYELDAPVVAPDDPALAPLVSACASAGSVALAGAPVAGDHIATLRIDADGVEVAYRKMWLGGDERARFVAGSDPVVLDVDGCRLGLGICKDTGVAEHSAMTAALGIDVYVAGLVHDESELGEQEARAARIAASTGAHVAFASAAGPFGGGYARTAGCSAVWAPSGAVLAQADAAAGSVAVADVPAGR